MPQLPQIKEQLKEDEMSAKVHEEKPVTGSVFERRIARREFLRRATALLGGVGLGSLLASCGPAPTPQRVEVTRVVEKEVEKVVTATPALTGDRLNLWCWSIYAPAFAIESFQEKYDVRVNITFYFGNSELLAKVMAGHTGADIIMPSHYRLPQYTAQNLIQPIDVDKIPNFRYLYNSVKNLDYTFYQDQRISIPYCFGVTGLAYNTEEVEGPVTSWATAWDPRYKGRILMEDTESWVYATAMGLGYRLEDLKTDTDAKLAKIKAKMLEQKPLLLKLSHGLEEVRTLFVSGDALVAHTDDGLAWGLQKDGFPVGVAVPQEGANGWQDQFCIPAEAPHVDLAHAWINHMLDPEACASLAEEVGYLTVNEEAASLMDPEIKAIMKHSDEELARVQWTPAFSDEVLGKISKTLEEAKAG